MKSSTRVCENIFSELKLAGVSAVQYVCVCVLRRDSCLPKETAKVHSQYHRNPPAGLATKERRCPGRKIKRGRCGESLKEGAKEKEREEKRKHENEGEWRACVCVYSYFAYFATSSSKATSCLQHMREWEWKLKSSSCSSLFSTPPQTHFADSSFLPSPLSFSALVSFLALTSHTQNLAAVVQLTSSWHQFH